VNSLNVDLPDDPETPGPSGERRLLD
jgi:hypothetical protein